MAPPLFFLDLNSLFLQENDLDGTLPAGLSNLTQLSFVRYE